MRIESNIQRLFANCIDTKGKLLCLGDSITQGIDSSLMNRIWFSSPMEPTTGPIMNPCLRRAIVDICSRLPSLHVTDGLDLVPHIPSYFGDEQVHPTDEGFLHYSINLLRKILRHLS